MVVEVHQDRIHLPALDARLRLQQSAPEELEKESLRYITTTLSKLTFVVKGALAEQMHPQSQTEP